jgi:hypothetical protein
MTKERDIYAAEAQAWFFANWELLQYVAERHRTETERFWQREHAINTAISAGSAFRTLNP